MLHAEPYIVKSIRHKWEKEQLLQRTVNLRKITIVAVVDQLFALFGW